MKAGLSSTDRYRDLLRVVEVLVEVAFCLESGTKDKKERIVKIGQSPLVVYFPTEKDTKLGFLIQGPYRTTPAARQHSPGMMSGTSS